MAIGLVQNLVSLSDILAKTTEEGILYYYFKTTVPGLISSPLREDRKPSFGFYYSNSGSIKWVDFSTRERGSLYDLLEKLWNKNFQEVLDKIYDDLPKFALSSDNQLNITKHGHNRITYSNETLLECKVREWRKYDLDYWESYGVSLPWLKFGDIYIKGVRSVKDFEYEREQADINLRIGGVETLLLYAQPQYESISSSLVRELIHFGKDVAAFLPSPITEIINRK